MIATLPQVNQKCTHYPPTFISPYLLKDENKLDKFFKRQLTRFSSEEVFNEDKLISLCDVFPDHCSDSYGDFLEDAAKDIYLHPSQENRIYYAKQLIQKGLEVGIELSEEEASDIIDHAREQVEEVTEWSKANKKYGREAANYAIEATVLGCAISTLDNIESCPRLLVTALKVLHGYALGMRGERLYGYIYGRPDDDRGVLIYQRDNYENTAGDLAELSCTFETYIKPWVLPFLGVLDSDKKDTITSLLTLPTNFLWSLRYLAFADQRVCNYLFKYAKNVFPAILRNEDSKKVLEDIIKSDALSINYLKERVKVLLRLKEGEKASSKLYLLFKGLFSSDIKVLENSARILNETIAPLIGIVGFGFSAIFAPLRAITAFIGDEYISDSLRRKIDSLASERGSLQNILYSLRFSTAEYIRSQEIKQKVSILDKNEPEREELERLSNEFSNLSKIGLIGNGINIIMPFVKLIDDTSSPFLKITKSIFDQVGFGISQWFFPKRRMYRGKLFEANNSDLFKPIQPPAETLPGKLRIYRAD